MTSLIFITSHRENIYEVKRDPKDVELGKTFKCADTSDKPIPQNTEKPKRIKNHDRTNLPKGPTTKPERNGRPSNLPGIPRTKDLIAEHDAKLKTAYTPTDLIKKNIEYAKNLLPRVPNRRTVTDKVGTQRPLKPSLEPTFLPTREYGTLPKYFEKWGKQKQREHVKMLQSKQKDSEVGRRYLPRGNRDELLNELKANWAELQEEYNGLPILCDTIPKIAKKKQLEDNLKLLERHIKLVEDHPFIYIYYGDAIP